MNVIIHVADSSHIQYAQPICDLIYQSAQARGTGIAKRSADYIEEKIRSSKSVIALDGDILVGFSYIETWSHKKYVANSGLIVSPDYRGQGFARKIKNRIFALSRELYPNAKIFSITTGLAVMKMNSDLGFKPVTFSELTDDKEFWKGCNGCPNVEILKGNNYKMCLCTGLLYEPNQEEQKQEEQKQEEIKQEEPKKKEIEPVTSVKPFVGKLIRPVLKKKRMPIGMFKK